jgi:insertion element IS1 protein InsB
VNEPLLQGLHPEHVEVEVCRSEELDRRRGLTSELDEMWSYVRSKAHPRWLWHAIDHHTGQVLAYVFGRRKDDVFLKLQELLAPFGITKFGLDHGVGHPVSFGLAYCASWRTEGSRWYLDSF